jgi:hypothetical protein
MVGFKDHERGLAMIQDRPPPWLQRDSGGYRHREQRV